MVLLILIVLIAVIGFLIWWLVFETEGVYLGRRVVVGLYDLYAHRYDRIKQFDQTADHALISQPLLERMAPQTDPLVLDVGTGTARLPLLMAGNAGFHGHVIGIDASRRMLDHAQAKVNRARFQSFITLLRQDASDLPFPDQAFDAVTCLEALEFMPNPKQALAEIVRVLRPGGLLLTTIRIDTRWMPDRTWSQERMRCELRALGMHKIEVMIWQEDYSQVWARKAGSSAPLGRQNLAAILGSAPQVPITYA